MDTLGKSVFIIVPLYNEAPAVRGVVESLLPLAARVVVVDDGSRDGGPETLSGLDITLIRHPFNLGQGAALQTGIEYALAQGAEYCITFDSDGQYLASELPVMLNVLKQGNYDMVGGNRFQGKIPNMQWLRWLILTSSRFMVRHVFKLKIADTQNGLRIMNRRMAELVKFRCYRMAHAMEIHGIVSRNNMRYHEHPCTMLYTDYSLAKGQKSITGTANILTDLFVNSL